MFAWVHFWQGLLCCCRQQVVRPSPFWARLVSAAVSQPALRHKEQSMRSWHPAWRPGPGAFCFQNVRNPLWHPRASNYLKFYLTPMGRCRHDEGPGQSGARGRTTGQAPLPCVLGLAHFRPEWSRVGIPYGTPTHPGPGLGNYLGNCKNEWFSNWKTTCFDPLRAARPPVVKNLPLCHKHF